MKEENFVSLICYYNEYYNKEVDFFNMISNFVKKYFKKSEIIIVCDDTTANKKKNIINLVNSKKIESHVSIIYLENYIGKEKALAAACDLAIGDYIIEFSDINCPIKENEIYDIYKKCINGNDSCILVEGKISFFDCIYYWVIKKFAYVKYQEYREDGIVSVVSRRMINRMNSIKKIVTNKWLFYKMSGLPCEYIVSNNHRKAENSKIEKFKNRLNTIFIFTSLVFRLYVFITILFFLCSLLFLFFGEVLLGLILLCFSTVNFGISYLIKKQSLNLEYLWTDSKYQYSSIEKYIKE